MSRRIRVVDDDPGLRSLYAALLEGQYDVETATDGDEALAAVDDGIGAVRLDRQMPGRSGDEVLACLRRPRGPGASRRPVVPPVLPRGRRDGPRQRRRRRPAERGGGRGQPAATGAGARQPVRTRSPGPGQHSPSEQV
ncbi:response regulator [Halomicroarcula sp. GCM10025743]|uniref:response regulator n=1 Tax=Haloarcula TaxID=2237 RepID=UPI00361DE35C